MSPRSPSSNTTHDLRKSSSADGSKSPTITPSRVCLPPSPPTCLAGSGIAVLDFDSVCEHRVEPAVVLHERRLGRVRQCADDVFAHLLWERWVQPMQRSSEPSLKNELGCIAPLARLLDIRAALT